MNSTYYSTISLAYIKGLPSYLLLSFLLGFCSSCGMLKSRSSIPVKDYNLQIIHPGPPWESGVPEGADSVFTNSKTHSIIMVNSICKRYQQSELSFLAQNLLSEVSKPEIKMRKERNFHGLDALEIIAVGLFNDKEIKVNTLTAKGENCVYDFILISSNIESFYDDQNSFYKLLNGVTYTERTE